MKHVPDLFDHFRTVGEGSRTQPFRYEHSSKDIMIGGVAIQLQDFDPDSYSAVDIGLADEGIAVDAMADHPALITNLGSLIGGPQLHSYANAGQWKPAETIQIMQSAYSALSPDTTIVGTGNADNHMSFRAGIYDNGSLGLQVQGNCACLGASVQGVFVSERFEHGYAEYDMHNTDLRVQRASLYAGFGHVAALAAQIKLA